MARNPFAVLGTITDPSRSTLGALLLLSYLGYLGGYALDKPELSSASMKGVVVFGLIWGLFVLATLVRNWRELTMREPWGKERW